MQGILVAPGVTDADFKGEIKIMTHSPNRISVIKQGKILAQLILLPQIQTKNPSKKERRRDAGFGSSDTYWVLAIGPNRP